MCQYSHKFLPLQLQLLLLLLLLLLVLLLLCWLGWLTSLSWAPLCSVSKPSPDFSPASQSRAGNIPPCQSGDLSLVRIQRDNALSLAEIMSLPRQLSYTIKTQLKAPKGPYLWHFLPLSLSLWHKVGLYEGKVSVRGISVRKIS